MYPRLIVGDSYEFTTVVEDYPATDGWTLTHLLRPRVAGDAITLTATTSGSDYLTTVTAAVSSGWEAGDYTVTASVANVGLERHTLDAVALSDGRLTSNLITILANPAEGEPFDDRSIARQNLDRLNATYAVESAKGHERYTVRDRETWFRKLKEIRDEIAYWQAIVAREERVAAGLPVSMTSYVRFRRV
jgi:hypothetical protein